MKTYRLFDHTADLGMEFFGGSREELFVSAGAGIFDVITDINRIKTEKTFRINVEGLDLEDLLVNWLRELLYLHQVKRMLLSEFHISEMDAVHLKGTVMGEPFDEKRHEIKKEVKAVTYHNIEVTENKGHWTARVIFDV